MESQPVAHGLWSCTITSLLGDLSSSVRKVMMAPKTQLWEETSQTGLLRPGLTGHLKKQKLSKDQEGSEDDLWGPLRV